MLKLFNFLCYSDYTDIASDFNLKNCIIALEIVIIKMAIYKFTSFILYET